MSAAMLLPGITPAEATWGGATAPQRLWGIGSPNGSKGGPPDGGQVLYEGGSVQHHPTVYLDFWGAEWTNGSADGAGYTGATAQSYVQGFVGDIGGSPWFASQSQFCDGIPRRSGCEGSTGAAPIGTPSLGGVWNDASAPVPTDEGVAAEADAAAAHFGLNQVVDATVVVLTPFGQSNFIQTINSNASAPFCGYHASTATTVYAYVPWVPDSTAAGATCPNNAVNATNDAFGHGHFDGLSIVLGDEIADAAADPFTFTGWIDQQGREPAAKCFGATTLPAANVAFAAGGNNTFAVQPLWTNSGWSCMTADLAGGTNGEAAVASWASDHRDVFIRGLDNALWWRRWNGVSWSPWTSLGGGLISDVAAVSWGVGRTDVFALGTDGALWHIAWTGSGWSPWQSLGGLSIFGHVAAASWAPGGLDVAMVGTDGAMWHRRFNGSVWLPWESLGGGFSNGPAAISWRDGTDRVDIFAVGLDNALWQDAWTGSAWSGWLSRGGGFHSTPALASSAPGRLQVYGIGLDNALWHESWDGSNWSGFAPLDHGFWGSGPGAISQGSGGRTELYLVFANQRIEQLISAS